MYDKAEEGLKYILSIDPENKFAKQEIEYINQLISDKKFKGNYAKSLAEYALEKGSLDNIIGIFFSLLFYFFGLR